ncbi:MAG TPA: hypothetical protein VFH61_16870, partial [Thermoleophilia bacterium]|nr:hypothetical protein [Thermoleophilia bacterium]
MPTLPTFNIKDGVLFAVSIAGGALQRNYLGMIKSGEATVTVNRQETTGPRDSAPYSRVTNVSASVTVTSFVLGSGVPCA